MAVKNTLKKSTSASQKISNKQFTRTAHAMEMMHKDAGMKKSDPKGTLSTQKTRLSNEKYRYWNKPMTNYERAGLKNDIKQTKANIKGAKSAIVKNTVKKIVGKK